MDALSRRPVNLPAPPQAGQRSFRVETICWTVTELGTPMLLEREQARLVPGDQVLRLARRSHGEQVVVTRIVGNNDLGESSDERCSLADAVDELAALRRLEVTSELSIARHAPQLLELRVAGNKLDSSVEPGVDELVRLRVDPDQGAEQHVRVEDDTQRQSA